MIEFNDTFCVLATVWLLFFLAFIELVARAPLLGSEDHD